MLDLRNALHLSKFSWIAQFIQHDPAIQRRDHHDFLTIPQDDFTEADLSAGLKSLAQQGISLGCDRSVRAGEIGGFIEGGMDFTGIDEPFDLDDLRALEFDFVHVLRSHDYILFRLELDRKS